MTEHLRYKIPARSIDGKPNRTITIKTNESDSTHPVFISTSPFLLLDEESAFELANALADIVEARRGGDAA